MAKPAYKFVVYAPRREDPTESTVAAPVPGSVHADLFQVASVAGVPGFKPYLFPPEGRAGKMDLRKRSTDVGEMVFKCMDPRTAAGNAQRWLTAFTGDVQGRNRLLGCRAQAWVSYDFDSGNPGAASWTPFWAGRIRRTPMDGRLAFLIAVRDAAAQLRHKVFTSSPHPSATAATRAAVLPSGVVAGYGPQSGIAWGRGRIRSQDHSSSTDRTIVVTSIPEDSDWLSDAVTKINREPTVAIDNVRRGAHPSARVRLRRVDTGAEGTFRLRRWAGTGTQGWEDGRYFDWAPRGEGNRVTKCGVQELLPAESGYMAMPPAGTTVDFYVIPAGAASEDSPIFVDDVHPVRFIADLLDGYYCRPQAGGSPQPQHVHPRETFAGAPGESTPNLLGDASFRKLRFIFTGTERLRDILSEVCLISGLAWGVDGEGRVVLTDLRLTSAAFSGPVLSQADLVDDEAPGWNPDSADQLTRIRFTYYLDSLLTKKETSAAAVTGRIPAGRIRSDEADYVPVDVAEEAVQEEQGLDIDARGLRVWRDAAESTVDSSDRLPVLKAYLDALERQIRSPYAYGPTSVRLACRHTDSTRGCQPGHVRLVNVNELPNPSTRQRGGLRPMRCVGRTERAGRIYFDMLDLPDSVAAPPTLLGAPAVSAGDAGTVVNVPVILNGNGELVEVWACATATGVAVRPADGDERWVHWGSRTTSGTAILVDFPLVGTRIWIRARTAPAPSAGSVFRLPSAFVFPAGAGYVDTPSQPRLLTCAVSVSDTTGQVSFSWQAADAATGSVRVHYGTGPADADTPAITGSHDTYSTEGGLPGVIVQRGQTVAVEFEPWSSWTGTVVAGTPGRRQEREATRATHPTPGIPEPSLSVTKTGDAASFETWQVEGQIAAGASTPLRWRWRYGTDAVGPLLDVPSGSLATSITLTRTPGRVRPVVVEAFDGDGRRSEFPIYVAGETPPLMQESLSRTGTSATLALSPPPSAVYDAVWMGTRVGGDAHWSDWYVITGPPHAISVALVHKHPSDIRYRVYRGGDVLQERVVAGIDVRAEANVTDATATPDGAGVGLLTAWFDPDTATGPGKAQYRVDGGAWTAAAVSAARTASWTVPQGTTAGKLVEVRGLDAANNPGPELPVTLPKYVPVLLAPSLQVRPIPGTTEYTIVWSGDSVTLSVDGGAYSTPPASGFTVARGTPGTAGTVLTFRGFRDGAEVTNSITIPALDKDTVTPDLTVTVTDTQPDYQVFQVTASNPGGGAAPGVVVTYQGCATPSGHASGTNLGAGPTSIRFDAPAYLSAPGTVAFTASIPGGGSETISRTILPRQAGPLAPIHDHEWTADTDTQSTWTFRGMLGTGGTGPLQFRLETADGVLVPGWDWGDINSLSPPIRTFDKTNTSRHYVARLRDSSTPRVEASPEPFFIPPRYDYLNPDGTTKPDKVAPGVLGPGVNGRPDFAVVGTTTNSVARHVEVGTGTQGAVKAFARAYDSIPVVTASLQKWTNAGAGERCEVAAIDVTKTTYTIRAVKTGMQTVSAQTEYFSTTHNGLEDLSGITISADGAAAYTSLNNANGIYTTYRVTLDVDGSEMALTNTLDVEVWRNDGPSSVSWTLVAQRQYYADPLPWANEVLVFDATLSAGWDIRVLLNYADAPGANLASVVVEKLEYDRIIPGTETNLTSSAGDAVRIHASEAP